MLATATRGYFAQPSPAAAITSEKQRAAAYGALRYASVTSPDESNPTGDAARQCLILNANQTAYVAALKAINPAVKVLVYKDFGGMKSSTFTDGSYSSGVLLANADPSWILKGVDGTTPCVFTNFPAITAADIGNTGYIDQFDANVGPEAISRGFDGIFLDDVNARLLSTPASATYTSNATYQAAVSTGMSRLVPKLHARGLLVVPNLGSWHDSSVSGAVTAGDALAALVGAGFQEAWASFGIPPTINSRTSLDNMILSAQTLQKQGGWHSSISHGASTDTQIAHLALAMDLLVMYGYQRTLTGMHIESGATGYSAYPVETIADPTGYANAALLGTPTEDAVQTVSHVWRRTFTNGQVWVNTDQLATHAVTFGGTYSGDGLSHATGATIALSTALILTAG